MINKQGKLFGKISFIDIFIILGLIFLSYFIFKKLTKKQQTVYNTQPVIITFFSQQTPSFTVTEVKEGDKIYDKNRDKYLGKITEVKISEGYMNVPDENGNLHRSKKEDYSLIEITSEVEAEVFKNGIIIEGSKYEVGHPLIVVAGKSMIEGNIKGIDIK